MSTIPSVVEQPVNDQKSSDTFEPLSKSHTIMPLDHLNLLLSQDPTNVSLLLQRIQRHIESSSYVMALRDVSSILKHNPKSLDAYLYRGYCYEKLLQFPQAMKAYNAALEIHPNHHKTLSTRQALIDFVVDMRIPMKDVSFPLSPEQEQSYYAFPLSDPHQPEAGSASSNSVQSQISSSQEDFDALIAWLRKGGAQFPKLHLKAYGPNNRGIHALSTIYPEETLLYVPRQLIITSEVARSSPIGIAITNCSQLELRSRHTYLACFLLEERRKESASSWYPYLKILPTEFSTVPLFFYESEVQELVGTICVQKVSDRLSTLYEEYAQLEQHLPQYFKNYTFNDFVWARVCIISRIFGLQIGEVKTDGLVPYADMLNHKLPRESRWLFHTQSDGFIIYASQTLPRGAPVHDSYGRKCNNRFLINYGFTLHDNIDNESVIRLEIPAQDPCCGIKQLLISGTPLNLILKLLSDHILQQESQVDALVQSTFGSNAGESGVVEPKYPGKPRREYQIPADIKDRKTTEMLSFLRFAHMTAQELFTFLKAYVDRYGGDNDGDGRSANPLVFSDDSIPSLAMDTASKPGHDGKDVPPPRMNAHHIPCISLSNELCVLRALSTACNASLDRFPTSLELDEQLYTKYSSLEPYCNQDMIILDPHESPYSYNPEDHDNQETQPDLSRYRLRRENYLNCLQMRMGEKRVLQELSVFASTFISLLTNSDPARHRALDYSKYKSYYAKIASLL